MHKGVALLAEFIKFVIIHLLCYVFLKDYNIIKHDSIFPFLPVSQSAVFKVQFSKKRKLIQIKVHLCAKIRVCVAPQASNSEKELAYRILVSATPSFFGTNSGSELIGTMA